MGTALQITEPALSEPSHVDGDAVAVFDVQTELLAVEPGLGRDGAVRFPIPQLEADGEASPPAETHFIELSGVRLGGFHSGRLRPRALFCEPHMFTAYGRGMTTLGGQGELEERDDAGLPGGSGPASFPPRSRGTAPGRRHRSEIWVVSRNESRGGWDVCKGHSRRPSGHYRTEAEAVGAAAAFVVRRGRGEVLIQGPDGTLVPHPSGAGGD